MTSKRYTGGSRQIRLPLFTNLGQKRASVRLKEFRKPDWSLSSDLFNQIVLFQQTLHSGGLSQSPRSAAIVYRYRLVLDLRKFDLGCSQPTSLASRRPLAHTPRVCR